MPNLINQTSLLLLQLSWVYTLGGNALGQSRGLMLCRCLHNSRYQILFEGELDAQPTLGLPIVLVSFTSSYFSRGCGPSGRQPTEHAHWFPAVAVAADDVMPLRGGEWDRYRSLSRCQRISEGGVNLMGQRVLTRWRRAFMHALSNWACACTMLHGGTLETPGVIGLSRPSCC